MKALKKLLYCLVVLAVLLVVVAFLLPAQYRIERATLIQAKPKAVFAYLNTLKQWPLWTAWTTERDPTMQTSFRGPEAGVGAVYQWTGKKVGNGKLTLTRSEPDGGVWYDLDFENGKYQSKGRLLLAEEGGGTRVSWVHGGDLGMNPVNRYLGLLMDRLMGPDFEEGLSHLKRIVEAK